MRKYLWFFIPFSLGTVYLIYSVVLAFTEPFGAFGLFVSIPVFLFGIVIGVVLQVIKSMRDREFRLSKITIFIVVFLLLYLLYALLKAYFPNIIP